MFKKSLKVARREFWVTIRRKGYIILTFGMPFFFLIYAGIVSIPGIMIEKKERAKKTIGIIDQARIVDRSRIDGVKSDLEKKLEDTGMSSVLGGADDELVESLLQDADPVFMDTVEEARESLEKGRISMFYVIEEDYLETGKVRSYASGGSIISNQGKTGFIKKLLIAGLLSGSVEPAIQQRIENPMELEQFTMEDGEFVEKNLLREISSIAVPLAFGVLLLMSIMMGSGYLLQSIAEEKESKVIEIILSSIEPDELLMGKLLGLGLSGLLQLLVWQAIALIMLFAFTSASAVGIGPGVFMIAFVYYILGFILFGSLMAGTGSLGNNYKESQQLSMMWSLPSAIPMVVIIYLIDEPNSLLARIMSYIPITSPITMIARTATGKMPWWEIPLTVVILVGTIFLVIKIFGKIFRMGLLMYGKRPSFKQIVRNLRD